MESVYAVRKTCLPDSGVALQMDYISLKLVSFALISGFGCE